MPAPLDFPKSDVQLGRSKVFLRKGAHNRLEAHRSRVVNTAAVLLQSELRGAVMRKIYLFHREAAMFVQRIFRGFLGRERARALRETKASIFIAKNLRMLSKRSRFLALVLGCTKLQRRFRSTKAKSVAAAVTVQSLWRMWCAQGGYWGMKKCIIVLQNRCRKQTAIALSKEMRKDMKNVGKLQEEKDRLKSEMGALKAMLKSQAKSDRKEVSVCLF